MREHYELSLAWLKAINSKPNIIHGLVKGVKVQIGEWLGTLNFSIVIMDDYPCMLGMEFMDRMKAIPIPFANSICIMEDGNIHTIPLA